MNVGRSSIPSAPDPRVRAQWSLRRVLAASTVKTVSNDDHGAIPCRSIIFGCELFIVFPWVASTEDRRQELQDTKTTWRSTSSVAIGEGHGLIEGPGRLLIRVSCPRKFYRTPLCTQENSLSIRPRICVPRSERG